MHETFGVYPRGNVRRLGRWTPASTLPWQAFRPGETGDARFATFAEAMRYATSAETAPNEWPPTLLSQE